MKADALVEGKEEVVVPLPQVPWDLEFHLMTPLVPNSFESVYTRTLPPKQITPRTAVQMTMLEMTCHNQSP